MLDPVVNCDVFKDKLILYINNDVVYVCLPHAEDLIGQAQPLYSYDLIQTKYPYHIKEVTLSTLQEN